MPDIHKNIKRRRMQLEMTQEELAKRLGYSGKSMISKIEQGRVKLDQEKIEEIAKILCIDPLELMGYKAHPFTERDVEEYMKWIDSLTPTADQARRDYEEALIQDIKNNVEKLSKTNLETLSRFCNFLISEQNEEKR